MPIADADRLRSIKTFPSLVKYLRDELDWPIASEDFDDLTFDYEPEELGLDSKSAVRIKEIKQLRPLTSNQPWGIFFVNFEPKRLPVVVLRRILRSLVIKKRQSANKSQQAAWRQHDLLFISAYGEADHRDITLANFFEDEDNGDLPTLRVLGWDDEDTVLHLAHAHEVLSGKLRWPRDPTDIEAWRQGWSAAFTLKHRQVITSSQDLAVRMAELAAAIRKRANQVLAVESEKGPLRRLMNAFREALIHDLSADDFADMYAQTITYGLLSARVSRPMGLVAENIKDMIPVTNPFLQDLLAQFLTVGGRRAGIDFDELGINQVVEALRDIDDLKAILRDFGDKNRQEDPVLYFYELFLTEYDPQKRMKRGVFYTPHPVVSFIVRSVHELLQTEFGLEDGLASTVPWAAVATRHPGLTIPSGVKPTDPFVVILDPAVGTATFLVEVIDVIHSTLTAKWKRMGLGDQQQRAAWNDYVPKHLLPRLYGYELMMAPYAIAHMKIGLKLYETGYRFGSTERARIYLTNALEPATDDKKQREFEEWAPAVAHEAQAVSAIKRKERFTVMIGNPPYSSAARMTHTAYLTDIMKPFTEGLGVESERKKGALQDDYIRFLALCRHVIRRTGIGIIGLITNNSYIDGTLHRAMRKSLIDSFARLLIVNLHGSSRAGHRGVHDENVFDIMQGVAIVIGATHATSPQFNSVLYSELIGTRSKKYERLATRIPDVSSLQPTPPYFLLRPMGGELFSEYETFVSVGNAFEVISSGIETEKDHFAVDFELGPLRNRLREFCDMSLSSSTVATRFALKSTPNWDLNKSRKALNKEGLKKDLFVRYLFHCFDWRYTYYSDSLITRSRRPVMRHMTQGNLALVCLRQVKGEPWAHVFVARDITNKFTLSSKSSNVSYHLPLFLTFDNSDAPILADEPSHQINLRPEVLRQVSATISDSKTHALDPRAFALKVFFFAYAIFHSPGFRSRYSDYLCLDFPRFPLPATCGLFDQLADLGAKLVSLHLLESRKLDKHLTTYVGPTKPEVEKVSHERCTAWLDKAQTCGFRGVPEAVWNLHIGGYQVCEKWLKDRKGRTLSEDDIEQYHSIVVALSETIRLMDEIDEVIDQHGGWPIGGSGRT